MIIGYFSLQYTKFDDFSEFQNAISNNQTLPPPLPIHPRASIWRIAYEIDMCFTPKRSSQKSQKEEEKQIFNMKVQNNNERQLLTT